MENMLINIGTDLFGSGAVNGDAGRLASGSSTGIAYWALAAFSYVLGLVVMVQSLVRLSRASQFSGGFSPTQSLYAGPLVGFLVAGALVQLPETWMTINETLFVGAGNSGVLTYKAVGNVANGYGVPAFSALQNKAVRVLVLIIQFVGWIAFIRGILMLKRAAEGGQASWGTAITHIVGGVLSSNVVAFVNVIQETVCRGTGNPQCLVEF